jgi:hypothetical protein
LREGKPDIRLVVSCLSQRDSHGRVAPQEAFEAVVNVLKDCPFIVTDVSPSQSHLRVLISLEADLNFNITSLFFALTLGIIPTYSTGCIGLNIAFIDPSGVTVKQYSRKCDLTTWIGWIFIFWGPAVGGFGPRDDILVSMTRDVVLEIYESDYEFFRNYLGEIEAKHN